MGKNGKNMFLLCLTVIPMVLVSQNFIPKIADALFIKIGRMMEGNGETMEKRIVKGRSIYERKSQGKSVKRGEEEEKGKLVPNLSVHVEGEKMFIDFTLENRSNQTVELSFSSGQTYDFWIYNGQNNLLYQWSEGKMFTMALKTIQLKPNQRLKFFESWDFIDRNGHRVNEKGVYHIVFKITGVVNGEDGINGDLSATVSIDTEDYHD